MKHINSTFTVNQRPLISLFDDALIYTVYCACCLTQTAVPWYEDKSGWCGFSDRIRTLHRKLHGHRVNRETKKAKKRTDGSYSGFLLPHQRHLQRGEEIEEELWRSTWWENIWASNACSHHCEGDARQSWEAHVDFYGFNELLGFVDVETQSAGSYDSKHNEESAAQACKVLQGWDFIDLHLSGSKTSGLWR